MNSWSDWLNSLSPEHQRLLVEEVTRRGMVPMPPPAVAVNQETRIPVICTPPDQLLLTKEPVYVDTFRLFPEYSKFAFQDHGNLLLKGPKGNGKSLSIRSYAYHCKVPLVVVECSENTKDLQLLGRFVLIGKETHFVLAGIPKAIKTANEVGYCILLFEEFNALTPQSQKLLNGALQERAVEVDALGHTYRLAPGAQVWFTGTMNPSVYGGTYDINEDLKSRMGEIEIDYPLFEPEKQIVKANLGPVDATLETIIDLVLRFAKESRQNTMGYALSTRDVVRTIMTVRTNGLQTALQMMICKYEGEDRKTALARLNSLFKNATIKNTWGGA
jgi:MoxR-like ATPase